MGEMHSDLSQSERDEIMFQYKSRKIDIIVATDILARGIDIDDIRIVINYDVPRDCDDYIHRVGRTARANTKGRAITFISEEDQQYFKRIEDFMEQEVTKVPLPAELGEAPEYSPSKGGHSGKSGRNNKGGHGGEKRSHGRKDKRRRKGGKPKAKKEVATTAQPIENSTDNKREEGKKKPQRHRYHRHPKRDKGHNSPSAE